MDFLIFPATGAALIAPANDAAESTAVVLRKLRLVCMGFASGHAMWTSQIRPLGGRLL